MYICVIYSMYCVLYTCMCVCIYLCVLYVISKNTYLCTYDTYYTLLSIGCSWDTVTYYVGTYRYIEVLQIYVANTNNPMNDIAGLCRKAVKGPNKDNLYRQIVLVYVKVL